MAEELVAIAQILSVLEKFTREGRDLIHRLLGPLADATGELLADKIYTARHVNLDRLVSRVLDQMHQSGAQARPVALTILIPVLQHASLESHEDLVSKWAGLLASAASGEDVHIAYPKILAEITPGEARLLDVLYRWETTSEDEGDRDLIKHALLSETDLSIAGVNLGLRHGLIHGYHTSLWKPDLTKWNNIALTPLGRDFVKVCRGPSG
jgi:hypothetical protein